MPAQALRRISWAGQVWHRRRPGRAVLSRLGAATVLAAVATLSVPAAPALAQSSGDMTALMERIERLQRDVNLLQRQVYRGEAPPPNTALAGETSAGSSAGFAAAFDDRINRLEEEARQLTGRVEEVDYSVRQVTTRLDKLVRDVDARLLAIEQQLATMSANSAQDVPVVQENDLPAGTKPLGQIVERRPSVNGAEGTAAAGTGGAAGSSAAAGGGAASMWR